MFLLDFNFQLISHLVFDYLNPFIYCVSTHLFALAQLLTIVNFVFFLFLDANYLFRLRATEIGTLSSGKNTQSDQFHEIRYDNIVQVFT